MNTSAIRTDNVTSIAENILQEWQEAKDHIYPIVLRSVPGAGELEQFLVCDKFLDLFICYYVRMPLQEDSTQVPLSVDSNMLEKWGISREAVASQARENLKHDGYKVTSIQEILKGLCQGILPDPLFPFYVLTNRTTAYGAAGILAHNMISGTAKKLGADLFLIPSSIHEFLILPDDGQAGVEELNRIVREVNDTQVEPRERLSDHVYYYSRERDKIEISM